MRDTLKPGIARIERSPYDRTPSEHELADVRAGFHHAVRLGGLRSGNVAWTRHADRAGLEERPDVLVDGAGDRRLSPRPIAGAAWIR